VRQGVARLYEWLLDSRAPALAGGAEKRSELVRRSRQHAASRRRWPQVAEARRAGVAGEVGERP
jgi:metal-responsive CopG/Arc/MetJ family transcriptional regulator